MKTSITDKLKNPALLLVLWLSLGMISIFSSFVYYLDTDRTFNWSAHLTDRLPSYILMWVFTPVIYFIAGRISLTRNRWLSDTGVLSTAAVSFSVTHRFLSLSTVQFLHFLIDGKNFEPVKTIMESKFIFLSLSVDSFFLFIITLGISYAVLNYLRVSKEEARITELNEKLARAETEALKMQLQPHFLFNTLNSVSALVYTNPPMADEMIAKLGEMLRLTLRQSGRQFVTLREEVEFVNLYLDIQKLRFSERFTFTLQTDTSLENYAVPNLILQPVVENCFRHGVERTVKKVDILLKIEKTGSYLEITVENTNPSVNDGGEKMSLKSISERLRQHYGDTFRLNTEITEDKFVFVLMIPAVEYA